MLVSLLPDPLPVHCCICSLKSILGFRKTLLRSIHNKFFISFNLEKTHILSPICILFRVFSGSLFIKECVLWKFPCVISLRLWAKHPVVALFLLFMVCTTVLLFPYLRYTAMCYLSLRPKQRACLGQSLFLRGYHTPPPDSGQFLTITSWRREFGTSSEFFLRICKPPLLCSTCHPRSFLCFFSPICLLCLTS